MADYRGMFDRDYIGSWDLAGRDVTVEIADVKQGELSNGKQKNKKPILSMVGKEKKLALNKTMCLSIAGMYGNDTRNWKGKFITLYPTTTTFGRQTVDCIRVREQIPQRGGRGADRAPQQPRQPTNDWREVLGLKGDVTEQDIEDAYSRLYAEAQDDEARIAVLSSARGYALKEVGDVGDDE